MAGRLFFYRKVARHQLVRPCRLANLTLLRNELCHNRLKVEHRSSVKRVKARNSHSQAVDAQQTAHRCLRSVGTRFPALGENSNPGQIGILAGVPLAGYDSRIREIMRMEEHLDMGKLGKPGERFAS